MPPVEFEPMISAGEWPQTYALDRAATGTGYTFTFYSLAVSLRTIRFNIKKVYMVLPLRGVFCKDLRTDSDLCCIYH